MGEFSGVHATVDAAGVEVAAGTGVAVMAIKKRIENERIDKIAGPPPPLERTDAFGNVIVPRKIPKVDAAKAKDARRRENEAEHQRKATEWAAEKAAKDEAKYQEYLKKYAWTALPPRETRSGKR